MWQDLQVWLQDAHVDMVFMSRDAEPPPAPSHAVHLVQLHQTLWLLHRAPGHAHRPTPCHPGKVICQREVRGQLFRKRISCGVPQDSVLDYSSCVCPMPRRQHIILQISVVIDWAAPVSYSPHLISHRHSFPQWKQWRCAACRSQNNPSITSWSNWQHLNDFRLVSQMMALSTNLTNTLCFLWLLHNKSQLKYISVKEQQEEMLIQTVQVLSFWWTGLNITISMSLCNCCHGEEASQKCEFKTLHLYSWGQNTSPWLLNSPTTEPEFKSELI